MLHICFKLCPVVNVQLAREGSITGFIRLFRCILFLSIFSFFPSLSAAEKIFSFEQNFKETIEIYTLIQNDHEKGLSLLNQRIIEASGDNDRQINLYLLKGNSFRDMGSEVIDEVLSNALPMIDREKDPTSYITAMLLQAFNMYTYKNQKQQAADLLESFQNHPAFKDDFYLHANYSTFLLEVYYKLNQYEKVSKPLFLLIKSLNNNKVNPAVEPAFRHIDQELAHHSGLIGNTKEAVTIYLRLVKYAEQDGLKDHATIAYCNIINLHYLPVPEKVKYAKIALVNTTNLPCTDVMKKLVILQEVIDGDMTNVSKLSYFNPTHQRPDFNERSAYYAGLAYLVLNDVPNAQLMAQKITNNENWERFDLLQRIYKKNGEFEHALEAAQRYNMLRAKIDNDARTLMLSSYQTRLEIAIEEANDAEKAKQVEQLAAAEQKSEARLNLMLTAIGSGVAITIVLTLYLYRGRQLQLKLQRLSDTDPLTDLLNRRAFLRQAEQLKQIALRQQFQLSVALIDLDFFKKINDQHGHHTGDAVLRAFANAAKVTLRQTDIIGRFGGEEFILATAQQDTATFAALLQRLQQCFTQMCLQDSRIEFNVTFSAGIANVIEQNAVDVQEIEEAIRQADEQLYRAKSNGRQQVCTKQFCSSLVEAESLVT